MSADQSKPDELSTHLAWDALSYAIRSHTSMTPLEGDPFGASQAASASHRVFSVTPGRGLYLGRNRAPAEDEAEEDRDLLTRKRTIVVTTYHDLDPGRHDASYQVADKDFEELEDALLVHDRAFRILQPELLESGATKKGHTLIQTLTLTVTTERLLPPMQE